jgi:hypothetical protein
MSEDKGDKEKEKKKRSVFDQLSSIGVGLSEALEAQERIMQSPAMMQAIKQATEVSKACKRITSSLGTMESINKMMKQNDEIIKTFTESSGMKMLTEYWSQINRLVDNLSRIGKMVKPIDISLPKLDAALFDASSQNDTLGRCQDRLIEFLERELSKAKAKNKQDEARINELLGLLEEKRKKLKEQYVV